MNTNSSPYFDDYVAEKKFSKILFKPGYAVQARELTQLQTMLQAQIERFGDNIFTEGTIIAGCAESHNFNVPFIKVLDGVDVTQYVGKTVSSNSGPSTGVSAIIKAVAVGSQAQSPNLNTLYVQYLSNDTATGLVSSFRDGDTLLVGGNATFTVAPTGTGFGSLLEIGDGIVYANGMFVLHSDQIVVIDRYNQTPDLQSINVGYVLSETITTSDDDSSLLDPASGSYNANAPGADRLTVSTVLTAYNPDTDVAPLGFFLLFVVEDGLITRRYEKTQYAELGVELAQRMYDESGDYTVHNFPLFVSEHLNNGTNHGVFLAGAGGDPSKLVVGVQPGKAYVRGYEQVLYATENLTVNKGVDTRTVNQEYVSTAYGNYILVDEVAGPWALNVGALVELHSAAVQAISGAGCNYSDSGTVVPSSGTKIGTARLRSIQYVPTPRTGVGINYRPGHNLAQYKMYLSDIVLTTSTLSSVLSIYLPLGGSNLYGANCFADTVSPVEMLDTKYTSLLFPLAQSNAKTLSSPSFIAQKQFLTTVSNGGTFSITTTDTWAFDPSTITNDETDGSSSRLVDENIIVMAATDFSGGSLGSWSKGKYFDLTAANVSGNSTTLNFNLLQTTTGSPSVVVIVNVRSVDAANAKTLVPDVYVQLSPAGDQTINGQSGTASSPYYLGVHDVFSIDNVWISASPTPLVGVAAVPATFAGFAGNANWKDVTSEFSLISGTTDSVYGIDGIGTNNPSSVAGVNVANHIIIVKFSWLQHASSSGYYTVQSYPLPAENAIPTSSQINWWQIPKYTASNGTTYNLRDTLDFRYTVKTAAGAGLATSPNTATNNPLLTTILLAKVTTPSPTSSFIANIQHHLPRIDRIVLDSEGTFLAVHGTASDTPVAPKQPNNAMTLGYVNIPAYPSLSPYFARIVNRAEYMTSVVPTDNRRFTMKDISTMESRLDRLEYQASLSALEQSAVGLQILNSAGDNRHKNGILVDSFIGHNIGNVYDPAYACSIADGVLRPFYTLDNVRFDVDSASNDVVQTASDAIIVVRQLLTDPAIVLDATITGTGGGVGTVLHNVPLASNATYRWVRLYLTGVSGTFIAENMVATASTTGTMTYTGLATSTLATNLQPPLVAVAPLGSLVTLPYTHSVYAENLQATQPRECASEVLFTFEGTVSLSPSVDTWMDTSVHSEVQLNTNNFFDNWKNLTTAWGTQWNDWRTLWFGKPPVVENLVDTSLLGTALTTEQRQSIDGISLASRIDISGNVIPFIRSQVVTFTATRLKATTNLHAYFDGVDVTAFCKNNSDTGFGVLATPLVTDTNGNIVGQFRIPTETFTVGTKSFILTDDATDPHSTDATTVAVALFVASGSPTFETRSVVSTRRANTTIDSQRQTQNIVVSRQVSTSDIVDNADPLSQTFFVSNNDGGMLLTKIDVYFAQKSIVSSITLQLREVVNGYPTDTILPFSSVTLQPADVNVSIDGTSPTEFKFASPVYLKNNAEYCFSLLPTGNDVAYEVWESMVGQSLVGSTASADKRPNVGSLFAVNNNRTWVELTNESITFTAYTAEFTINSAGTLVLSNKHIDYSTLTPTNPGTTYNPGDTVVGLSGGSTGQGTILYVSPIAGSTAVNAQILVTSGAFLSSDTTSTGTLVVNNLTADALAPSISQLTFNAAPVEWGYQIYLSDGTPYSGFLPLDITGTLELTTESAVYSYSNAGVSSTFQLQGTLSTTSPNISPIIDLDKVTCVIVCNRIDNLDSVTNNETNNTGTALTKYISRTVILDDGEDAEDLRVYFSALFPSNSGVQVWAKTLNAADPTLFVNREWSQMTQNLIQTSPQFNDYYFTLLGNDEPSVSSSYITNGVKYTGFRTFAIKIVLTSGSTTQVPLIKDLRVIALLV